MPSTGSHAVQITDRDRELLRFAAEHRIVLATHAQALFQSSPSVAYRRLSALSGAGLLSRHGPFYGRPRWYQITRAGLASISSDLAPPRSDERCHEHDVGVAWLWLAARGGAFGPVERLVSERRMRSKDAIAQASDSHFGPSATELFGVRLGGVGPGGRDRLHYPDLLLMADGLRVALELELTSKGRRRREGILAGYGADSRLDAVVYFVDKRTVGRDIRTSSERLGLSQLVHVQRVTWSAPTSSPGLGAYATRDRPSGAGQGRAGARAGQGRAPRAGTDPGRGQSTLGEACL